MNLAAAMKQAEGVLDALEREEIDYGMFLSCLERERRFRAEKKKEALPDAFANRQEITEALTDADKATPVSDGLAHVLEDIANGSARRGT